MCDFRASIPPAEPLRVPALSQDAKELQLEVLRLRDAIFGLRAEKAELSARMHAQTEAAHLGAEADSNDAVEHLELVVHDLQVQLAAIKSSTTWRVGRLLVSPVRLLRSLGWNSTRRKV